MTIKELMNAVNAKREEVKSLLDADKLEEAKAAKEELVQLTDKLSIAQSVEAEEEDAMRDTAKPVEAKRDAIHDFAEAARHRFVNMNNETTPADGGYTVPEDIQTRINKFREARFGLQSLVDTEPVSTMSGRRTYQTRAQHTGFTQVAEGGKISAKNGPQFTPISYNIKKYAGYLPVTNELLADSDANISNTLIEWLGEEDVATRNAIILAKVAQKTATPMTGLDDVKKAINVTLGQAFAATSAIVTNDDGFNWLDTLKTSANSNEYLLKPAQDQTNPIKYYLAVGARQVPVIVVPNAILASPDNASDNTKIDVPLIIGDLKEYCKIFDRALLSIMTSNVAAVGSGASAINAFEEDLTIFRGIERLDCVVKDASAIVNGTITLPKN